MYTIKVNEQHQYQLDEVDGRLSYKGEDISIDIQPINNTCFHVLYNNKSFSAEVIEHLGKTILLRINAKEYLVEISDKYDELLHKLGLDKTVSNQITDLKAPMPGLVLNILVKEGDQISKGDTLIILEAMKMENSIKSPVDGTVKNIKVTIGDKLEKNQVMISF